MTQKKKNLSNDIEHLLGEMQHHQSIARKVLKTEHLDIDSLFDLAEGNLSKEKRLHVEAHLSVCEECRQQLEEIRGAIKIAQDYQPEDEGIPVPDKVLQSIPKPGKQRGAYAKLVFGANGMLKKVQGVAKSMGGMIGNLADFTIEALAPDMEYLADTRGTSAPITDYRTYYDDIEVVFSTSPDLSLIEVYLKIKGKALEKIHHWNFLMVSEGGKKIEPTHRIIVEDTLKLIFRNLDLNNRSYEFQIPSQPVSD